MPSGQDTGPCSTVNSSGTLSVELFATREELSASQPRRPRRCLFSRLLSCVYRAANGDKIFVDVIIKAPVLPIFVMLTGASLLALEWPLPYIKDWSIRRSFVVRIVALVVQAFLAILFYQVSKRGDFFHRVCLCPSPWWFPRQRPIATVVHSHWFLVLGC